MYLIFFLNSQIIFADPNQIHFNTKYIYNLVNYLGNQDSHNKSILKLNAKKLTPNFNTQLSFSIKNNTYTFDETYFQYKRGILTFGIGSISRNWSFSPNTSLILSSNARPSKAIYFKVNNESNNKFSFEIFNGITENSLGNKDSLLLGARLIVSPIKSLKFELLQTSQWAGSGYNNNLNALYAALINDTNDGENSNINKIAGFGISYTLPIKKLPTRIYAQAVGEDEAGSLPSSYMYLAGIEWQTLNNVSPKRIGFEIVDTRIEKTEHGFCGPNTAYNNGIYDYTNYGLVLGAPIDTESKSIEIYGDAKIMHTFRIKFSLKKVIINDKSWTDHRLSSSREVGLIKYGSLSWEKDKMHFTSKIYHQDIDLDKGNYKNKIGIGLTTSLIF